jgi:hypothetical protein
MTLYVFSRLVDANVSEVIDCKFIRENECDVVLSCQRVYPFYYLDIFEFLVSVKINNIYKSRL